jgi:replicative DNA helicase
MPDIEKKIELDSEKSNEDLKRIAYKEEPRLLSLILRDNKYLMETVSNGIKGGKKGHFWNPKARFLYDLILYSYKKYGSNLTRTGIDSIMDSINEIDGNEIEEEDKTSIRLYWDDVYSMHVSTEDFNLLIDNINNRYIQVQAVSKLRNGLNELISSKSNQNQIIKDIKADFLKIDNLEPDSYSKIMSMEEGFNFAIEYIKGRRENPQDVDTVLTGIKTIDKMFYGFERGSYTVVTGFINGGKSTLMFNMGMNMAQLGYNVVYVSIEKAAKPLYRRLLSLYALIDYNRIKRGGKNEDGLSDYYYNKFVDAANEAKNTIAPHFDMVQVSTGTTLTKIISLVEEIKSNKKIDVLIVDYLGVIGPETHHQGRADLDEAKVSQRLQAYGRENMFVTITGAQLKTTSAKESRNKINKMEGDSDIQNFEVNTEDIAGSKVIIADADNCISCALNNDQPPTKMIVRSTKARDDESKVNKILDFDGKLGRVSDPQFEDGQITDVDKWLYNQNLSDDDLDSDDLFTKDDSDFDNLEENEENTNQEIEEENNVEEDFLEGVDDEDILGQG